MNDSMVLRQRNHMRIGVMALAAVLAACVALCMVLPAQAQAASYTLGKSITKTFRSGSSYGLSYSFTVPSTGADVNISVSMLKGENNVDLYSQYDLRVNAYLVNSSGSYVWSGSVAKPGAKATGSKLYLAPGTYQLRLSSYDVYVYGTGYVYHNEKVAFKISKLSHKMTLSKKSGKFTVGSTASMPAGTSKTVACLKYTGSYDYANKNIKIAKNSKPKVASASVSVNSGGKASLVITPKNLGKTVISVKMAGGNTVKYTVYATTKTIYVAKGNSAKIGKPIGIATAKYKSNKSRVAKVKNKKTGKISAKKQGKAKVSTKYKGVKYTCNVVVTDFKKLAKVARTEIRENVPDPSKVRINKAYRGLSNKTIVGGTVPVVWVDYTYPNENGGSSRDRALFVYTNTFSVAEYHGMAVSTITSQKKKIKI